MWTLNVVSPAVCPALSFSTMSGSPAAASRVGSQSWWLDDLVGDHARRDPAGPADHLGTRKAPSQFVFFSLRNGVIPPSGQVFMCGPLSVL